METWNDAKDEQIRRTYKAHSCYMYKGWFAAVYQLDPRLALTYKFTAVDIPSSFRSRGHNNLISLQWSHQVQVPQSSHQLKFTIVVLPSSVYHRGHTKFRLLQWSQQLQLVTVDKTFTINHSRQTKINIFIKSLSHSNIKTFILFKKSSVTEVLGRGSKLRPKELNPDPLIEKRKGCPLRPPNLAIKVFPI